jgi:hypothetical protein
VGTDGTKIGAVVFVAVLDQEGRHQRVLDLGQHDREGLLVLLSGDLARETADERVAGYLFEDARSNASFARNPGPVRTATPQTKHAPMRSSIAITSRSGSVSGNPPVIGATSATTPPSAFRTRSTLR